jgi:hypothetical protein
MVLCKGEMKASYFVLKLLLVLFVFEAHSQTVRVGIIDLAPLGYLEDNEIKGKQRDEFDAIARFTG